MDRPHPHAADGLAGGPGHQRQVAARRVALAQPLGSLDEPAGAERPLDEGVDQGMILGPLGLQDRVESGGLGRGGRGMINFRKVL
jgi:hypothetical protein